MTTAADLLVDAFTRIGEGLVAVVDGLSTEQLATHVSPGSNPIGWLAWHLVRVQDAQVADVAGTEQVWTADGWHDRFGLTYDPQATGYGQSPAEVDAFTASGELLADYARAVTPVTLAYVAGLGDDDLDRVVDERWDPPVTLGVRLLSIAEDDLKHLGQAEYLRGTL